ncbi:hypothetical protein ACHAXN_007709 [Cyclotella atomus]
MRFRPLSIDYRTRAQEILLIERDDAARRAARSLLPHHFETNSDIDTEPADAFGNDDYGKASTAGRLSLESIYSLLGPAVHPSECALRSISPVSKGPIRGVILPVQKNSGPFLEELIDQYERIKGEERKSVVLALESGRSRFQEPLLLEEEDERDFFGSGGGDFECDENLFHETMMVFYSKDNHPNESSDGCITVKRDNMANNASRQEPIRAPLFIRHQPPDLNRIHQLKNLRARGENSSFADALCNMFQPKLKSLSEGMVVDFQKDDLTRNDGNDDVYIGPKFDPTAFCSANPSLVVDYSRDWPGSFTGFFDRLEPLQNVSNESSSSNMISPPSNVLEALDNIGCFLRIDPDVPTDDEPPIARRGNLQLALSKSLDGLCSATFISSKLGLPARFEGGHEIIRDARRFLVPVDGPRFQFLEKATMQIDDLPNCTSFESCLKFIEARDVHVADSEHLIPRKISLESDIKLFGEPEEDKADAMPTTNEMMTKLPSYASQLSFTPRFVEKGIARQMRHVKSSARVVKASALENVVDSSCSAPSLFLPQVKVPKRKVDGFSRKRISNDQDAVTQLVRSCLPNGNASRDLQLLQQLNSDYPITNWFNSTGTGMPRSHQRIKIKQLSEHQKERNISARVAFCEKAQAISRQEAQRTLILTGCISRRNASAMFAYRGILTNQLVDHQVYAARYALITNAKKAARVSNDSASRSSFVDMVQNAMIASLLRDGTRRKRGAQLAKRLKTSRHGLLEVTSESSEHTQLDNRVYGMELMRIHEMASLEDGRPDVSAGNLVEELGETLKKERGELLHLVAKAEELEKEEEAYLEELAVLNRISNTTKDDLFDFTVESAKKRKNHTEYVEMEQDEKKQMKKKHKKDKRKNETPVERAARKLAKKMRKEERKRKSNDDPSDDQSQSYMSKREKRDESIRGNPSSTEAEINSSFVATFRRNLKMAAPSLNLGITPIVPPRPKVSQAPPATVLKVMANSTKKNALSSVAASHKIKDSTLLSIAKTNSPDSVASLLNEGRKLLFSHKKQTDQDIVTTAEPKDESEPCDLFLGNSEALDPAEIEPIDECNNKAVRVDFPEEEIKRYNNGDPEPASFETAHQLQSITLLSSESFLENFSEVVAELASGRWTKALAPSDNIKIQSLKSTHVSICDCPLVDIAGVDIELSAEKGAIVQRLSSWLEHNQGIQKSSRLFIKNLVELAASGRYKYLHIIFCTDIDVTSMISSEFVTLQNALAQQCGCHCEQVTFEFVRPRVLPATLALHLLSNRSQVDSFADTDENTIERARFLLMLVPSMTVHMAFQCIGFSQGQSSSSSGKAFYNLLNSAKTMERNAFVKSKSSMLSETSALQLWLALHVDISHAH